MWERYRERDKKRVLYRVELKSREGAGVELGKSWGRAVLEVKCTGKNKKQN